MQNYSCSEKDGPRVETRNAKERIPLRLGFGCVEQVLSCSLHRDREPSLIGIFLFQSRQGALAVAAHWANPEQMYAVCRVARVQFPNNLRDWLYRHVRGLVKASMSVRASGAKPSLPFGVGGGFEAKLSSLMQY